MYHIDFMLIANASANVSINKSESQTYLENLISICVCVYGLQSLCLRSNIAHFRLYLDGYMHIRVIIKKLKLETNVNCDCTGATIYFTGAFIIA